jgi:hypothetical protein
VLGYIGGQSEYWVCSNGNRSWTVHVVFGLSRHGGSCYMQVLVVLGDGKGTEINCALHLQPIFCPFLQFLVVRDELDLHNPRQLS